MVIRNVKTAGALSASLLVVALACGRVGVEVIERTGVDGGPVGGTGQNGDAGLGGSSGAGNAGSGAADGATPDPAMDGGPTPTGGASNMVMGGMGGNFSADAAADSMAAGGVAMGGMTAGTGGTNDWWDTDYRRRVRITIDNQNSNEAFSDFPVLVSLRAPSFNFAATQSGGTDVRFVDDDGLAALEFEIETWQDDQSATIWVKIPNIPVGADHFWMYYDNPGALEAQFPENVWSANYRAVWQS